ncbi:MAG: antibiotic biosynthesis monooxygenase family protein [Acidimicrobiales bacterium]
MVTEHAVLDVTPGQEDAFLAAFERGYDAIAAARGFVAAGLHRGVEHPSRFVLLVQWATLEDHTEGFRRSPAFAEWRAIIGPFLDGDPRVEHYGPADWPGRPAS